MSLSVIQLKSNVILVLAVISALIHKTDSELISRRIYASILGLFVLSTKLNYFQNFDTKSLQGFDYRSKSFANMLFSIFMSIILHFSSVITEN